MQVVKVWKLLKVKLKVLQISFFCIFQWNNCLHDLTGNITKRNDVIDLQLSESLGN